MPPASINGKEDKFLCTKSGLTLDFYQSALSEFVLLDFLFLNPKSIANSRLTVVRRVQALYQEFQRALNIHFNGYPMRAVWNYSRDEQTT
jgi:hypothetical protein